VAGPEPSIPDIHGETDPTPVVPGTRQKRRTNKNSNKKQNKKTSFLRNELDEFFIAFWSAYPKKEGQLGARKAFQWTLQKQKVDAPHLIAAAQRYAAANRDTEPRYLKGAQRWLRDGHWNDESVSTGSVNAKRGSASAMRGIGLVLGSIEEAPNDGR
jgi:hypothetical protein